MTRISLPVVLIALLATDVHAQTLRILRRSPAIGRFHGQIVDLTKNHGADRRIWSEALAEKRDLYIYLPPGYDPSKKYPFIFWLHGIVDDEQGFLKHGLPEIDQAMACGKLAPAIVAIPDGSLRGRPVVFSPSSAFLNTRAGAFEDFLFCDVYDFIRRHYSIRSEREAHVLAGVSLGGGAAFHHAIVRREEFGVVVGIFPSLNLRWMGPHGRYFANFDPDHWQWREHYQLGLFPAGKFVGGIVNIPWRRLVHPLYGDGRQVIAQLSRDNPIEMLDAYNVKNGELDMLIAYCAHDQFNIDAQVESFVACAKARGLEPTVLFDRKGRHNTATALRFLPDITTWLAERLEPYRVTTTN